MKHENLVAVPPDGGWGWIIIAICSWGFFIIDVPSMGFQVLLPYLKDLFDKPPYAVSFIFSTYTLLLHLAGPIAGGVCNRFGFTATALVGSVLFIAGVVLTFFIENYIAYVIIFGILAGTGSSLVLLVCTVASGFWFEEKRSIALGIVSSATAFSVFSVPLLEQVNVRIGWRNCFLLWAGLMVVMAFLALFILYPPMIELRGVVKSENLPDNVTARDVLNARGIRKIEMISSRREEVARKVSLMVEQTGIPLVLEPRSAPSRYQGIQADQVGCARWLQSCQRCCKWKKMWGYRPLYRKDIFYQGNLGYAVELENVSPAAYTLTLTKLPTIIDVKQEVECHCRMPEAITRGIKEMIDFSLFKSYVFLLLATATLFCYIAFYVPFLQIKRINTGYMKEAHASLLPIIMGIGLIFFRSSAGFVLYNFPRISSLLITALASFVGGLVFCSVPLTNDFAFQIILAFCGGAFPAVIYPLRSVVIIEQLGVDNLTSSTGTLFLIQGIACFIGLPIAEFLIEATGYSYAGIVFCGVCYIIAGISFSLIDIVSTVKTV